MKKYTLPVIFFLLCLILYMIYVRFQTANINLLYIGDNKIFYKIKKLEEKYNLDKYTFDSVTYKELEKSITSNSYKVIKDKNIYLNQLISKSDVIIMSANNFKYKSKCKKDMRILKQYDIVVSDEIKNLVNIINKISDAKIYIIGNHCNNKDYIQDIDIDNIVYISYENAKNIGEIIHKTMYN